VEKAFSLQFRKECKDIATGNSNRKENKYLYIPAGDARPADDDDPPPSDELLPAVSVHYQQGVFDSCLRHSMASAFHAMGFVQEAKTLALEDGLSGCTVALVERAVQFVRKLFQSSNLVLKKVFSTASSVYQVTQEDHSWPLLLIIQTSDGIYGSHAVTAWNGMIFDSTCPFALRWSQTSLDWCSGQASTCIGFSKVYRLCPVNFGAMLPGSTIQIGTQIQGLSNNARTLGWVRRLPTKKENGEQKKGYIVNYIDGTVAELNVVELSKYALNNK
jgi:hypothetical protein